MSEKMKFLAHDDLMTLEEIYRIVKIFANLGVSKVRLTGGEPLIRRNLTFLVEQIASINGIEQISLTTNASRLDEFAVTLYEAGVRKLNISLDTLDENQFHEITRIGKLDRVLASIDASIATGFKKIRLNTVIMRNKNESQIIPLVDYARKKSIDIAFIEEMPLGYVDHDRKETFISNSEIFQIIAGHYLEEKLELVKIYDKGAGPADYWGFADGPTKIGFISPHSDNFCKTCNRVRLTASGKLLLCLGQENSIDLKEMIRLGKTDDQISTEIRKGLLKKPSGHEFNINENPIIFRHMNATGG